MTPAITRSTQAAKHEMGICNGGRGQTKKNRESQQPNSQKSNNNFNLLLTESVRRRLVVAVCRGLILKCSLARAMEILKSHLRYHARAWAIANLGYTSVGYKSKTLHLGCTPSKSRASVSHGAGPSKILKPTCAALLEAYKLIFNFERLRNPLA